MISEQRSIQKTFFRQSATKICIIYLIIGLSWIIISDRILFTSRAADDLTILLSTLKGVVFVIVTDLILYGLIAHYLGEIENRQILYQNVVENAGSIIMKINMGGIVTLYNEYAEKIFRRPANQVIGRSLTDLRGSSKWIPGEFDESLSKISLYPVGYSKSFEWEWTADDGVPIWILWTVRMVRERRENYPSLLVIGTEITEQKLSELSLSRINRELKTISECNQALIHETGEDLLLHTVCRIIVGTEGYRMAWIGYPQEDEMRSVLPLARAGDEGGYLDLVKIGWGDTASPSEPAGRAVRTGSVQVIGTISEDMDSVPWKDELIGRGYASAISLPLKDQTMTIGVLTIYEGRPDAFDKDEIDLLIELAGDLSYGILAIRTREKLEIARKELFESEERLRLTLDATNDGLWDWKVQTGEIFCSPRYARMLEYEPGDLCHTFDTWLTLVHPEDRAEVGQRLNLSLEKGDDFTAEFRMKTRSGGWKWILGRGKVVKWDQDRGPLRMVGTNSDITDRKVAEEELIRVSRELRDAIYRIDQNMGTLATLNDMIRNPLTVIEILSDYLEEGKREEMHSQVEAIDRIIRELDKGWIESDKVRNYMKKHHGLFDGESPLDR